MAEWVVAATAGKGIATKAGEEIGTEITVRYGRRVIGKVRPKRIKLQKVRFEAVTSFYQRIQYDRAFSVLSGILDDYRSKEFGTPALTFEGTSYRYRLSITHAQDYGLLMAESFGDTYSPYDPSESRMTEISASSARVFFWPVANTLSLDELHTTLDRSYRFFRTIESKMLEEMKTGGVGGVRDFFYLSFASSDVDSRKLLKNVPDDRLNLNNSEVSLLVDDSSVIASLMKSLK